MSLSRYLDINNEIATNYLKKIEDYFKGEKADVLSYFGSIEPQNEEKFKKVLGHLIEEKSNNSHSTLVIILQTNGGSAETTKKFVDYIRSNYEKCIFIVPKHAMSAGTIWCMSGDEIYMSNLSHLGPIDPQIYSIKEQRFIPANGYIEEYENLIQKSRDGLLTNAELAILANQDLGFINSCKQSRELAVDLLKKWLVKYKFKNWNKTETNKAPVTQKMKEERAEQIARVLGDNSKWRSHGYSLSIKELTSKEINLKIENYSNIKSLNNLITEYVEFMDGVVNPNVCFMQTRNYI